MFESKKNNIFFKLWAWLSPIGNLVIIWEGKESLIEDFTDEEVEQSFKWTIVKFKQWVPYQTEVVNAISKNGANLIVQRAVEPCPMNWTSTELVQNKYQFDEGDIFYMNVTAWDLHKIDEKFSTKLDIDWWIRTWLPVNSIIYVNAEGEEDVLEFNPEVDSWKALLIDENWGLKLESPSVDIWWLQEIDNLKPWYEIILKTENGNEKAKIENVLSSNIWLFVLWESISQADIDNWYNCLSIFKNQYTTPTLNKEIWRAVWSQKIAIPISINKSNFKIFLAKVWNPTSNLDFRIETDDWNWKPSWTLVNENAIYSLSQSLLTTSLVLTNIDFWTLINSKNSWLVIETSILDITNYYLIWAWVGINNDILLYNWVTFVWYQWANVTDSHSANMSSTGSVTDKSWLEIFSKQNQYIKSVNKHWNSSCTLCQILNSSNQVIWEAAFIWNTATFKLPIYLSSNTTYKVIWWNNWSTYTRAWTFSTSFPYNWTNLNIVKAYHWSWWNESFAANIIWVTTILTWDNPFLEQLNFFVNEDIVVKSDASNVNKNNVIWFIEKPSNNWDEVVLDLDWIHQRTILNSDIWKDFYLWNVTFWIWNITQNSTGSTNSVGRWSTYPTRLWNTFILNKDSKLTNIQIAISKQWSPTWNITLKIFTAPWWTLLKTSPTLINWTTITTTETLYTFQLEDLELKAWTYFYEVSSTIEDVSNYFLVWANSWNPYIWQAWSFWNWAWSSLTNWDCRFILSFQESIFSWLWYSTWTFWKTHLQNIWKWVEWWIKIDEKNNLIWNTSTSATTWGVTLWNAQWYIIVNIEWIWNKKIPYYWI